CIRGCLGSIDLEQGLLPHTWRPFVQLSLCALYVQLVVAVEAGVEGEKLIEDRGEEEQVALAQVAVRVHGQFGAHAAYRQATVQAVDLTVTDALEAAEQALADALGVLVVVARQVVGLEDH